jgi:DNA repair protein RecO (recombination protein O)
MPPPRVYKTAAIVLRHRKLGEADKILTLFTPNYGKLDAVAKGVRRPTSKLAGHVEPLTYSALLLAKGRELDIVTQAETLEPLTPLREDLERVGRGLYAAELVDRFTPDRQESYPIFRLLLETLRRLATRDDLDLVLRYFEMQLLHELGYRPQLDRCVACEAELEPTDNFWSAASGGVLCLACGANEPLSRALSLSALKVLRLLQRSGFADAARVRIDRALAPELERHLREYIRYVLEREVRSIGFVDAVRRQKATRAKGRAAEAGTER